jgi:hypothetical protein
MSEYTDLSCGSPEIAEAVLLYLNQQLNEQDEPPFIMGTVVKSTLRLIYRDEVDRREWDMQLMGFRDGYSARSDANTRSQVDVGGDVRQVLSLLDGIENTIRSLAVPLPMSTATGLKLTAEYGLGYVASLRYQIASALAQVRQQSSSVPSELQADIKKVVEFVACSRILFAHHVNVQEGDYLACLRCSGESKYHGRELTPADVVHDKGCPVALAVSILPLLSSSVPAQPESEVEAALVELRRMFPDYWVRIDQSVRWGPEMNAEPTHLVTIIIDKLVDDFEGSTLAEAMQK